MGDSFIGRGLIEQEYPEEWPLVRVIINTDGTKYRAAIEQWSKADYEARKLCDVYAPLLSSEEVWAKRSQIASLALNAANAYMKLFDVESDAISAYYG